jgi:two-component sensor histidine kinase
VTAASELPPEVALSLALALVASSNAPVLLLDGALTIVAASASFCHAFQIDPTECSNRPLSELGAGEWNRPQLISLLKATSDGHADIAAYEMDLERAGRPKRCVVINAKKLSYGGADEIRLLVAITDVTEARLSDKLLEQLLQEKNTLLAEIQHRVANSLQIIASVLLQNARSVQSEETRRHLYDAHNRVMSVATLQQQLAISGTAEVQLRPYLTDLCRTIGASMIHDRSRISLEVRADSSVTGANVSVSLGLIVTELVINALKHAFPGQRPGKISVDYRSSGLDWTLVVGDDGVGMPTSAKNGNAGLGTSIVNALANQLKAKVRVADGRPGAIISIAHTENALEPDVAPI